MMMRAPLPISNRKSFPPRIKLGLIRIFLVIAVHIFSALWTFTASSFAHEDIAVTVVDVSNPNAPVVVETVNLGKTGATSGANDVAVSTDGGKLVVALGAPYNQLLDYTIDTGTGRISGSAPSAVTGGTFTDPNQMDVVQVMVNTDPPFAGQDEFTAADRGPATYQLYGCDPDAFMGACDTWAQDGTGNWNGIQDWRIVVPPVAGGTLTRLGPGPDYQFTFAPGVDADSFQFQVQDVIGLWSTTETVNITYLTPGNLAPEILTINGVNVIGRAKPSPVVINAVTNQPLSFEISASDQDAGDIVTLSIAEALPPGATCNFASGNPVSINFTWTPTQMSTYNFTAVAKDDAGVPFTNTHGFRIIVADGGNQPPVIATIDADDVNDNQPDPKIVNGSENTAINFTVTANDADTGQSVTLSILEVLPAGASFTGTPGQAATYTFSWTPDFTQAGTYPLTVTAADSAVPPLLDTHNLQITIQNTNQPPVLITAIGDRSAPEGQLTRIALSASDPDGTLPSFQLTGAPGFVILTDHTDGTADLDINPSFSDSGTYPNITVTVSDAADIDSETFTLTVTGVNQAPVLITAIGDRSAPEGQLTRIALSASDPDGTLPSFQLTGAPGFVILTDHTDGTADLDINPSFSDSGTYPNITVTVSDAADIDSETFTLTVTDINQAPVLITAIGNRSVPEGQLTRIALSASDPDGTLPSFQLTGAPGFVILTDHTDGTADLDINPSFSDSGTYPNITVTVSDAADIDSETFTLTVTDINQAPVLITAIGNRSVPEGQLTRIALSASDPDGTLPSFQLTGAPGFVILTDHTDGTADLDINPSFSDSGTYPNITVTVSDAADIDSETFTLTVEDVPAIPGPITDLFVRRAEFDRVLVEFTVPRDVVDYEFQIASVLDAGGVFPADTARYLSEVVAGAGLEGDFETATLMGGMMNAAGTPTRKFLMGDAQYYVRVRGRNALGNGPFSNLVEVRTILPSPPSLNVSLKYVTDELLNMHPVSGLPTIEAMDMLRIGVDASSAAQLGKLTYQLKGEGSALASVDISAPALQDDYDLDLRTSGITKITVKVSDIFGQSSQFEQEIHVTPHVIRSPSAALGILSANGTAPLTSVLRGSGRDGNGWPVELLWDFDGDFITDLTTGPDSENQVYTYSEPGTYAARFCVKDNEGFVDCATGNISVSARADSDLVVTPRARSATVGRVPFTADFDVDVFSTSPVIKCEWYVDRSLVYAGPAVIPLNHTFEEAGNYNVSVRVTAESGIRRKAALATGVRVWSTYQNDLFPAGLDNLEARKPTAGFRIQSIGTEFPVSVAYLDESAVAPGDRISSRTWDFDGDGLPDRVDEAPPAAAPVQAVHVFTKPGIFVTCLKVKTVSGFEDTYEQPVNVTGSDDELPLYWMSPAPESHISGTGVSLMVGSNIPVEHIQGVQFLIRSQSGFNSRPLLANPIPEPPYSLFLDVVSLITDSGFLPGRYFLAAEMLLRDGSLVTKEIPVILEPMKPDSAANTGNYSNEYNYDTKLNYDTSHGVWAALADSTSVHLPPRLPVSGGAFTISTVNTAPISTNGFLDFAGIQRSFTFGDISFDGLLKTNVLITIPYRQFADGNGNILYGGKTIPENSLAVYRWDGARWIRQPTVVNLSDGTVTAWADHFSTFAIAGSEIPGSDPDPPVDEDDGDPQNPTPTDDPPAVNAGADRSAQEGSSVQLNGVVSDDNRSPMTIRWLQEDRFDLAFQIGSENSLSTTLALPLVPFTTDVKFRLEATDANGTFSDSITITVENVTVPPGGGFSGGSGVVGDDAGGSGGDSTPPGGDGPGEDSGFRQDDKEEVPQTPAGTTLPFAPNTETGAPGPGQVAGPDWNFDFTGGESGLSDLTDARNADTEGDGDQFIEKDHAEETIMSAPKNESGKTGRIPMTTVRVFEGKVAVQGLIEGEPAGEIVFVNPGQEFSVEIGKPLLEEKVRLNYKKVWRPVFSWTSGLLTDGIVSNLLAPEFKPMMWNKNHGLDGRTYFTWYHNITQPRGLLNPQYWKTVLTSKKWQKLK